MSCREARHVTNIVSPFDGEARMRAVNERVRVDQESTGVGGTCRCSLGASRV